MTDDHHGPGAGCGWQQCGVTGDAHNCPFTRDEPTTHRVVGSGHYAPRDIAPPDVAKSHQHEWRQLIFADDRHDLRFYCIHCLVNTEHPKTYL